MEQFEQQDAVHTITYSWTKEQFVLAMAVGTRLAYQTRLAWSVISVVLAGLLLLLLWYNWSAVSSFILSDVRAKNSLLPMHVLIFSTMVFLGLLAVVIDFNSLGRRGIMRRLESGDIAADFIGKQCLHLTDDAVVLQKQHSSCQIAWENIYAVHETERYLFILCRNHGLLAAPVAAFTGPSQAEAMVAYARERMHSHKRGDEEMKS